MDFSKADFRLGAVRQIMPVYSALDVKTNKFNKAQLNELSKSVEALASSHDIKVNSGTSEFKNNVFFRDGVSGSYIKIGLSDENLETLKRVFGSEGVYQKDSKSVILNGKAESFVSGWFGDIAYQRGYLAADSNNNGSLNKEEQEKTHSYFGENWQVINVGQKVLDIKTTGMGSYYTKSDYASPLINAPSGFSFTSQTIEAELNRTLSADKNQDKKITQNEIMSNSQSDEYLRNSVAALADTRDLRVSEVTTDKDEIKMLEALQARLKLETLGKAGLNKDDIEALAKFFPSALSQAEIKSDDEKTAQTLSLDEINNNANINYEQTKAMQSLLTELQISFEESLKVDKLV